MVTKEDAYAVDQALRSRVARLLKGTSVAADIQGGGASDGNFTSLYAPTLDGLGAVGNGAHAEHEFGYIDPTIQRCALLALLLLVLTTS